MRSVGFIIRIIEAYRLVFTLENIKNKIKRAKQVELIGILKIM